MVSGSLRFRLSTFETGSTSLATNAISMSTSVAALQNGQLWNFYLTRGTGSLTTSQSINMYAALQNEDKINPVISSSLFFINSRNIWHCFIFTNCRERFP